MKLVLASRNQKKLRELQEILSELGVEVLSEADVGVDVDVEETGTTFEENAFLKADAQKNAVPIPGSSASQSIDTPGGSGQQTDEDAPAFCPFCGKELNDSFQWGQFCPYCGKKVEQ